MQQAHDLFGDRAGPAHDPAGQQILRQGMPARRPIDTVVRVKALIFSQEKRLLQEHWDVVEGTGVMHIPRVLIRYRQWHPMTVQYLGTL